MTEPTGKFAFLNQKDAITFLRLMLIELRKLTVRDGFSGVRLAMDNALKALKAVEKNTDVEANSPIPVKPQIID